SYIGNVDLAHQVMQRDRPLIFIAVIGAERHQPLTGPRVRSDKYSEGDQVIAPDRIVLERHVIVAAGAAFEVQPGRADNLSFHAQFTRCALMKSVSTSAPMPGVS